VHRTVTPEAIVRELRFWPDRRPAIAGTVPALTVDLLIGFRAHPGIGFVPWALLLLGAAAFWSTTAWWWWDRLVRPLTSAEVVLRADEHSDHNHGVASWMDIAERNRTIRRDAPVIRASLAGRDLSKIPVTEYASVEGHTGAKVGPYSWTQTITAPLKVWTLITGSPQMGKSQQLACRILDHPGSALVTSTRVDLLKQTGHVRSQRGRVWVFNPLGLDGIESNVRWSPLIGCDDWDTAVRRAGELIPDAHGDAGTWHEKGRRHLPVLLHAAALAKLNARTVADWVEHSSEEWVRREVVRILKDHTGEPGFGDPVLIGAADELFKINVKTADGFLMAIMEGLKWSKSATAAAIGDAALDDPDLIDIRRLIALGTETLYLVCPRDYSGITPLMSALTSEVAFQVIKVADGRRLDPPMLMALDEAYLTCPGVDLAKWTSDMGGAGCPGVITLQSVSQLDAGWGRDAAGVIAGNMGTVMVFGGTKGDGDLSMLSRLTGVRMKRFDEDDDRPVGTMNEASISAMQPHEVLLFLTGMRPVRATALKAFERADVQAATRCGCGGSERSHLLGGPNGGHVYSPSPFTSVPAAGREPEAGGEEAA
jgi:type IV secretion system protein VirD4